jgi:hypothetical protein
MTKTQQEIFEVALELLKPLNDPNHNYDVQPVDLEDRAAALATTLPVLFKVELRDEKVDEASSRETIVRS